MGVEVVEPQADNQDDQTSRLFPNALRISGLKHVCDNLCGSILAGLPQLLGCSRGICARTLGTQHIFCFESSCHHHQKNVECLLAFNTCVPRWSALLPQLQSLDIMLSSITWRERFVALCFSECTMQDRNKVLKWSGESLTGLRWQVVSAFCREAIWLIIMLQVWQVPQCNRRHIVIVKIKFTCLCSTTGTGTLFFTTHACKHVTIAAWTRFFHLNSCSEAVGTPTSTWQQDLIPRKHFC